MQAARTPTECVSGLRQEQFRRRRLQRGDDASCDVEPMSHNFYSKRFFLPQTSVEAKPFQQFFSSRKEFRTEYECAFKCAGWEVPKINVSDAT